MYPSFLSSDTCAFIPWYLSPPACTDGATKSCPSVNILNSGVNPTSSPKSYLYSPSVSDGHAAGSAARNSVSVFPSILSFMNGNSAPPKLLPPPVHAIIVSGVSSTFSSCVFISCPITVWCNITWFSTLPSVYFTFSSLSASSTASDIAIPSDPGWSGVSLSIFLPTSVLLLGDAYTFPSYSCMIVFLNGFWLNDTFTMYTVASRSIIDAASDSAVPHCPAPVSVVSLSTPSFFA